MREAGSVGLAVSVVSYQLHVLRLHILPERKVLRAGRLRSMLCLRRLDRRRVLRSHHSLGEGSLSFVDCARLMCVARTI